MANWSDPKQSDVVSLSQSSFSGSTKNFMIVLGWCRSSHAAEFGNVFDGDAPITVSHGFLSSRRYHHENNILLRITFQIVHSSWLLLLPTFAWRVPTFTFWPSPSNLFFLSFFPFCCSTVCRTELGRMTCFCTIVTDATAPYTFALPFAFLHGVQFTIWTSWCVGITNVPILSPLCCVLTIIQIWITVRPFVCTWRGTLTAGVCPNAMFSDVHWCNAGCVVSDENNDLIFQVVGFNFVFVDLCFHRSTAKLWDHPHVRRFDDGAGNRFLWRLSSKHSDQLPDHVQQVDRFRNLGGSLQLLELTGNDGCALHVPPVELVGESVLNFSCCLGSRHVSHRRTSAFTDHFDYCFIVHLKQWRNFAFVITWQWIIQQHLEWRVSSSWCWCVSVGLFSRLVSPYW